MTQAELYAFTNSITGETLDPDQFNFYLDLAQAAWEDDRPWMWLRKKDSSQSASPTNTFQTAIPLATDFRKWYSEFPIKLVGTSNIDARLRYKEIPLDSQFEFKNANGKFYVDYAGGNLYLCGIVDQAYTVNQFYIKTTTLVSADPANTWVFPVRYHKFLGLMASIYFKRGFDFDLTNVAQADQHAAMALGMLNQGREWDDDLQRGAIEGLGDNQDMQNGAPWQSGTVPGWPSAQG